ncbi:nuclear transport factor 2 family protein [Azospirillum halopraeferens]|uniref:nuclear transport factor 2 family protein n=1 Tax=Azospirillum halopraeferens TaxID=34010 RepID=UPI0003F5B992|nr:nuclear transport factor 2 family protein [Azospirillum halopraeferens]
MTAPPEDDARRRGLDDWAAFFEGLSTDRLDDLDALTAPDVRFKDPFNDVRGRAAVRAVLEHTLASCRGLRFTVTHRAFAGDLAFLRWRFEATVPVVGALDVTGMSEVALAGDGRVAAHVDHWDAGEHLYLRLPLLGPPLRLIRRRLAGPAAAGRTG